MFKRNISWSKSLMLLATAALCLTSCKKFKYDYETVEGDVLKTKMYTLENGLKVYMTENHDEPRIQTFIAVHAGSKHEPAETTGLAHYLEHMLFKGSSNFGTVNFEEEKPLLDQITELYETYRKTTDESERKAIYHQIDSISYEASSYFIPNEYDKLMAHIGAKGSNAFTSYDQTVYTEDIPSNEVENWAKIQSDRFKNMVLRGFHTELEAVYEEFNKYLNSDWDHLSDAMFGALTPTHPYSHSVIGLGEHLKNPSIVNILDFFHKYYVPNNMAICLSGDFNPDDMIDVIIKYFGDMEPNTELEMPHYDPQPELMEAKSCEVITPNPEMVLMGWRFDGAASHQNDTLQVLTQVLHNGTAGLFDLDLNLTQLVNSSSTETYNLCDYSVLMLEAQPQTGQSLDELKTLLLGEVDKLRKGEFDDDLVQGIIAEAKLNQQASLEANRNRAMMYVDAFINDVPWADQAKSMDRLAKIKKEDVVAFANKHLLDTNFVVINKRQGEDPAITPVPKPAITPIQMNRDTVSVFAKAILDSTAAPIEPVFLDFQKDLTFSETDAKVPVIYRENTINDIFQLTYLYDMGQAADRYLPLAAQYLNYLGTDSLTAEEIQQKFFLLGCKFDVRTDVRETRINLSGLQENMPEALRLLDNLLTNVRPDSVAFQNLILSNLQERQNMLSMFDYYSYFLRDYLTYGLPGVELTLTNEELQKANYEELIARIRDLRSYEHRVLYYGPAKNADVLATLNNLDQPEMKPVLANNVPAMEQPSENLCFVYPYHGTTSFVMSQYACTGTPWKADELGAIRMYNEYFGAGMNTVVFQEMREKRSLCYGAGARYNSPNYQDTYAYFVTNIQSQNDKLGDCIDVFSDIVNNMPASQTAFDISKQGLITQLRTERTTRQRIIEAFLNAEKLGLQDDPRKMVYDQVQDITMDDIVNFQQTHVKDLHYRTAFAADPAGLNFKELSKLGTVKLLSAHEVFGY